VSSGVVADWPATCGAIATVSQTVPPGDDPNHESSMRCCIRTFDPGLPKMSSASSIVLWTSPASSPPAASQASLLLGSITVPCRLA
jgi:hypothetical protein